MRIEIILFLITAFIVANIYTDGGVYKKMISWKKYFQMGAVIFGAFVFYWLFTKNPAHANKILCSSNEYLKYMPIDKNSANIISPILDFTSKQSWAGAGGGGSEAANTKFPVLSMPPSSAAENKIMNSGKKATKRCVSETKKKFVAAQQNWKCGKCTKQLPAWFEVDHKIRLEYGGSNHVDNLLALCRECHGKKTAMENL